MSRRFSGLFFCFVFLLGIPGLSHASEKGEIFPTARVWHEVTFDTPALPPAALESAPLVIPSVVAPAAIEQRTTAFVYSDFYNTRRKIHMAASYATIPLFVAEYLAGNKLYDGDGSSTAKSAHGAFTAGLAALFGVNTITGGWNLWEGRKDPNGRTRRIVHSLLMFGADAGFVATASLAPNSREGGFTNDRSAHRNMAIASMGMATASYVYMLVTR